MIHFRANKCQKSNIGGNIMLNKKSVDDINVKGKKVLVRCDFNAPLDENKNIKKTKKILMKKNIKTWRRKCKSLLITLRPSWQEL